MMSCQIRRRLAPCFICAALSLTTTAPARAADAVVDEPWQFYGSIYLWAAAVGGETVDGQEIDLGFSDLLENLDLAVMGALEARKDKWSALADIIYVKASADNDNSFSVPIAGPLTANVAVDAEVEQETFVTTLVGGYNVVDSAQGSLDVIAGARYLWLDTTITLDAKTRRLARTRRISGSDSNWDGVAGVRGRVHLSDKWFIPYYVDVGAGESDLTWQALGGIGYEFERFDAVAGYRHLDWDLDGSVLDELDLSGVFLGARIQF